MLHFSSILNFRMHNRSNSCSRAKVWGLEIDIHCSISTTRLHTLIYELEVDCSRKFDILVFVLEYYVIVETRRASRNLIICAAVS